MRNVLRIKVRLTAIELDGSTAFGEAYPWMTFPQNGPQLIFIADHDDFGEVWRLQQEGGNDGEPAGGQSPVDSQDIDSMGVQQ
jgi:hypothetical protein